MAELINAIATERDPQTNGMDNLESLGLCFAAVASAETGKSVKPGEALGL
ncbi:hypothetical protein JCM19231_1931 [Vibrio ishigakensis]|uniref:Uncharacterized protein n=2 Tax=Vibrio ishigakensis TaxID=1481914 RepID=A0A0B8NK72_9VIBR|nr:hypothetical protein JCM19231_1931 [Vibrio ishigakensis]